MWCDLVFRCISNSWYSVRWEGKSYGFFKSYCEVRQGDPLSPSLFLMLMEWFSREFKANVADGSISRFYNGSRVPSVSHLLFTDDLLIFWNGPKRSIENLMSLIHVFCQSSAECLNNEKSLILFPRKFPKYRKKNGWRGDFFQEIPYGAVVSEPNTSLGKRGNRSLLTTFFQGPWGHEMWEFLGRVFDKGKLRSVARFKRLWLCKVPTNLVESSRDGMHGSVASIESEECSDSQ
ncbi:hypothetical protein QQ045_019747 [Rhodiola kirilowii]